MKKFLSLRVVSLLVLFVFLVSVIPGAFAVDYQLSDEEMFFSNTYPTDEQVEAEIEQQQPAIDAYWSMLDSFEQEFGEGNYPENYAGAFITEDYKLCILLTENTPQIREMYEYFCADSSNIIFGDAEYSYETLEDAFATLEVDNIVGFTSAYIDIVNNDIKVGVRSDIATYALSADPIIDYIYEQPGGTESTELYGGTALVDYTLGGCGSYQGKNAVVLCGHSLSVGDSLRLLSTNTAFAKVVIQQFATDENYDYAVATINTGASVTLSNKVKNSVGYTTITSQARNVPPVGTTVCMYGQADGFGVGKVTATSSVLNDSRTGVVCYGLVKCRWNEGQEAYGGGSSGGPVYAEYVFYGTYSGSNTTGGDFWFSPISYVPGFTIKTS